MAKHRRRRRFRKYLRGNIDENEGLGALATHDVLSFSAPDVVTEKAWLSSVKAVWSLKDLTSAQSDGPVVVGVAHSDYTATEIEAWIENAGAWDAGNMVAQEVSRRKIRIVGSFTQGVSGITETFVLNDGRAITTKCGWMLTTGDTVQFWAFNTGSGNLITGSFVSITGHANLWPA